MKRLSYIFMLIMMLSLVSAGVGIGVTIMREVDLSDENVAELSRAGITEPDISIEKFDTHWIAKVPSMDFRVYVQRTECHKDLKLKKVVCESKTDEQMNTELDKSIKTQSANYARGLRKSKPTYESTEKGKLEIK